MLLAFVNRALSLLLVAGATLCLLFVVFSGAVSNFPFNEFYWLQADTSTIKNAGGDVTRWTFWGTCHPTSYDSSKNGNCSSTGPDEPLSPLDNFGNSTSLPRDFVTNRDTYYYLSRFAFPLLLIALIFSGVSFICHIFGPCWTSMRRITSFFVTLAMLFVLAGSACQTAVSALAKQKFSDSGISAKLGPTMMGLSWAAVACLLIVFFLTCWGALRGAYIIHRNTIANQRAQELNQQQQMQQVPDDDLESLSPNGAQQSQLNSPLSAEQSQKVVSGSEAGNEFTQGALPSNEGGIRFFKIKRNRRNTDEESL